MIKGCDETMDGDVERRISDAWAECDRRAVQLRAARDRRVAELRAPASEGGHL